MVQQKEGVFKQGARAAQRPQRSEDAGPHGAPLGITTISTDTFAPRSGQSHEVLTVVDRETGELFSFEPNTKTREMQRVWDKDESQLERWLLQRTARRILSNPKFFELRWKRFAWREYLLSTGAMMGEVMSEPVFKRSGDYSTHQVNAPLFRVVQCHQTKLAKTKKVELWQAPESGYVRFHNLGVCGSAWTCPICSPRIGSVRRDQISAAYEAILGAGGTAYMVTFTIRHGQGDDCSELVSKLKEAGQILMKSRAWKNITRKVEPKKTKADAPPFMHWLGRIAALEVTHGANGWHPHEHHLFFFTKPLNNDQVSYLKFELSKWWQSSCVKAGLPPPSLERGLDIRIALSASDYLTKFGSERGWSIERELVQADKKRGRGVSRTPFQLLYDAAQGDNAAARLFAVFAESFKGRSQLEYSRTLLKWLKENASMTVDTTEEADIEISAGLEQDSKLLGELDDSDFETIVRHGLHGLVLTFCRHNGFEETVKFIRCYKNATPETEN